MLRWASAAIVALPLGCAFELVEPTRSCRELGERGTHASGVYTVRPESGEARVYCEMAIDGGGWTLIARSVESGEASAFGYAQVTGDVEDLAAPYSAGASTLVPDARELLVTAHQGNFTPAVGAYVLGLPASFYSACADQHCGTDDSRTIFDVESCNGAVPFILGNTGYVARVTDRFLFRDTPMSFEEDQYWGLFADGFNLNASDCPASGFLHLEQGLLFAR